MDDLFTIVERAKQELQITIDAIVEGVVLYETANLNRMRTNWPFARMFQTSPHQLVAVNLHSLLCECTQSHCQIRDFLCTPHKTELDFYRQESQRHWVLTVYPLADQNQAHTRSVLVARDVTELRQAEQALRESEAHYRSLFDSLPIGLYLTTPDGNVVDFNPALIEMLAYPDRETLQKMSVIDDYEDIRERLRWQELMERDGAVRGYESRWKRYDGKVIWVRETSRAIRDAEGHICFYEGAVEDITKRKRVADALHQSTEKLRALSSRLAEAEENERQRLSQELHDQVGQNLTALNINFNVMRGLLSQGDLDQVSTWLDDCSRLVEATTARIRNVMADLRPPLLDEYGLLAALRWYAQQFEARTGVPTQVSGAEPTSYLPPAVALTLFRIVQEALNNVAKHAQAQHVAIRLQEEVRLIHLEIADDGCGFEFSEAELQGAKAGWGLSIMQERAHSVGGRLSIASAPQKGARVVVEVSR